MPASLPGATLAQNQGNPTQGVMVLMAPLSGPKASPLDASKIDYSTGTPPGWNATTRVPIKVNDPLNLSTGALSTGVGFGGSAIAGAAVSGRFPEGNFMDDYTPGVTKPDKTAATNSTYMFIGGGRSNANGTPNPYTAGFGIAAAGGGGAREAGALGFTTKTVTAAAGVAVGAVIETGFVNRSPAALTTGQSVFGVASAAQAAPTLAEEDTQATPEEAASDDKKPAGKKRLFNR